MMETVALRALESCVREFMAKVHAADPQTELRHMMLSLSKIDLALDVIDDIRRVDEGSVASLHTDVGDEDNPLIRR